MNSKLTIQSGIVALSFLLYIALMFAMTIYLSNLPGFTMLGAFAFVCLMLIAAKVGFFAIL